MDTKGQSRSRAARLGRTIGNAAGQPAVVALLAAILATAMSGLYAVSTLRHAERALSGPYAHAADAAAASREAALAFAQLRTAVAERRGATDPAVRQRLGERADALQRTLAGHLAAVAASAPSIRGSQAALDAQDEAREWRDAVEQSRSAGAGDPDLDRLVEVAEVQFNRLVATAAADELRGRADMAARLAHGQRLAAVAAGLSIVLAAALAWCLARRARRSLTEAARALEDIAAGDLDRALPLAESGALGVLLRAVGRLRESLRDTAARERAHLRSPAIRLARALDAVPDAVLLVEADGSVTFANAAAAPLAADAEGLRAIVGGGFDLRMPDGRPVRARRSLTAEGTLVTLCGEAAAQSEREARLVESVASLRAALDHMSQGLCLYDCEGRLVVVNGRYAEIYRLEPGAVRCGMTALEVLERCVAAGNHPDLSVADLLREVGQVFDHREQAPYFQELGDGRVIAIVGRRAAGGGFVATYEDVTERWHAESRIAHMARHDMLTGLPNRVLLGERIEGAITQASRESGFAVLCLDLDNFKQVNDTLGHAIGDELLRAVANRLASCLRETDTVARLGGDEFAIVQAGVPRREDAAILARRIIDVLSAPYALTDHAVTVGVSIGIALAPSDGMDCDRLMKNADVALYRAKSDGRGVFRFFESEMDARLQARRLLEIDLRAAVAEEVFELHYQPIYDLRRNRICGFEALLRWTHPTRGPVAPADFIPLAEEIGLIVPLGEWVLRQACREATLWPDDLKLAVNVSPAQFQSAQLVDVVREALARSGLAARRLELEITESVLLVNGSATIAILHALRGLGARVSMDDFGTGYSSLSYLRSFPFDKMKIDKSFIRDLTAESGSGFIVRAVISLGSSLGMTMTAEGVETEAQLARLREEGCDEVQGYLFSRPVPARELPALIKTWNTPARTAA